MSHRIIRHALILVALLISADRALGDQAEDQFNFATGLFIEGDYELAADEFQSFLQKHGGHALAGKAHFQLGESLMRLDRYKDAVAPLETYIKRNDTEPDKLAAAYFRLAKARAALGEYQQAAELYQVFAAKFADHQLTPAARYWVGECLLRAGKPADARQALQVALAHNKGSTYEPYCIYGLGCTLQTMEKFEEAVAQFHDIVNRFGKEEFAADACLRLGQCFDALGRFDDALRAFETQRQRFGDKLTAESWMGTAWAYFHKKDLDKAADTFAQVAAKHPEHPSADFADFNAASAFFNLGMFDAALARFDSLSKKKIDQATPSLYWKGMCLLKLGKAADALQVFQSLANVAGDFQAMAHYARGEAFFHLEQFDNAQQAYEAVAARFPKDDLADDALHAAATAASERDAHDHAINLAQRLIQQFPQSSLKARAQFLIGSSLFEQKKYPEATGAFKALLKEPGDVSADAILYKIAWCFVRQNDPAGASQVFRQVATEHAKSDLAAEALYMAGKLLTDQGKHADAQPLYQQCVRQYPNHAAAQHSAYALALAEFTQQRWQQAVAAFDQFIKSYPEAPLLPRACYYLGESNFAQGQYDPAAQAYGVVIQKHRTSDVAPQAACGAAWCLRQKGNLQQAADAFQGAAAAFPKAGIAAEALYWAGRCRMDLDQWTQARELFAAALGAVGVDNVKAEISYSSAHCLLREKRHDEAAAALKAFLQQFAASPLRPNALYDLAWVYLGKQDEKQALSYFQQVAETDNTALKADALFRLAEADYAAERYQQAADRYTEVTALKEVSFSDKAYYKLGWSFEKLGKLEAACGAYQKVAEVNAKSELAADSALRAGLMLQQINKHDEAAKAFGELAARPGVDKALAARARFQQAESLRSMKRWAEALNLYRSTAAAESGLQFPWHAHYGAGVCAFELNAFADARRSFEAVIEQTETETAAKAQMALGEILLRENKPQGAAREFLKVHILYGFPAWQAESLLRAAECFIKAGQQERSTRYLEQLVEKFPDSEPAGKARKMLGK